MSRILLVDDSPHAQRMGERILSEEGFEVVTVSNADSALIRMDDVDPDVVLADTVMPGRSGYEICQFLKMSPRHRHVRVVLTAGVLEPLDDEQVKRVEADATLKKPFEASVLIATVKPLAERAVQDRAQLPPGPAGPPGPRGPKFAPPAKGAVPFITVVDAEQVRAAVTVALDAAMEKMVDEIAARVLAVLQSRKSPAQQASPASTAPEVSSASKPAPVPALIPAPPSPKPAAESKRSGEPAAPPPRLESVRRVSPLRSRPGSILGLDLSYPDPEVPSSAPRSPALDSLFPNVRPAADPDPSPRRAVSNTRPAVDPDPGPRGAVSNTRPAADPDPSPRRAVSNTRPAVDPDSSPRGAVSNTCPAVDPDPSPRGAVSNTRPAVDPDPSPRGAVSNTRPAGDPDPSPRGAVSNTRPAVDPDPSPRGAASSTRPAVDPDPSPRGAVSNTRPAADPESSPRPAAPDKK
ncbi:MAG: response regulator [Bryobacteraceae bacterium]